MATVNLKHVVKRYGSVEVIPPLDLSIPDKSFTVLVGPSGCGKSTLLRMIAGLEEVTDGTIEIDGEDITDVDPSARGIAMVFQNYALYPHMSVAANIGFALKLAKTPKAEIRARVEEAAEILELQDLLDRKPKALSGGQRQRVAIGRAIVRKPKVFLFDEPLSNLDAALRGQMRVELAELQAKLAATIVYVTHDQVEAMTMAHQIVVLNAGEIQQAGPPLALYDTPANSFVAQFIGAPKMNMFDGALAERHQCYQLGIRPEHLRLDQAAPFAAGIVQYAENLGADTIAYIAGNDGDRFVVRLDGKVRLEVGTTVGLAADRENLIRFAANGESLGAMAHG